MTIRVLIGADDDGTRTGYRAILDAADGIEVVGEIDDGRDAVKATVDLRPDVCLFDVALAGLDGLEATRRVAERSGGGGPRVVIVTAIDGDEYLYGALEAGATGFLLKDSGDDLLAAAVRSAYDNESMISPAITTRLLRRLVRPSVDGSVQLEHERLTDREEQVLAAVASGSTNGEIARQLHLSVSTVKANVSSLLLKVEARNRVELAIWAYRTGRVDW